MIFKIAIYWQFLTPSLIYSILLQENGSSHQYRWCPYFLPIFFVAIVIECFPNRRRRSEEPCENNTRRERIGYRDRRLSPPLHHPLIGNVYSLQRCEYGIRLHIRDALQQARLGGLRGGCRLSVGHCRLRVFPLTLILDILSNSLFRDFWGQEIKEST